MTLPTRFRDTGLEYKRLGMIRLVLTSGSQGDVDSITVNTGSAVELLDPDGLGAQPVTYASSLANFGKLIADKINEGTALHGFQARAGVISSLTEVLIYDTQLRAYDGAVTVTVSAELGDNIVITRTVPTGRTAGKMYGQNDAYADLVPGTDFAADDFAVKICPRIKEGWTRRPLWAVFAGAGASYVNTENDTDGSGIFKARIVQGGSSTVRHEGISLGTAGEPTPALPIQDWTQPKCAIYTQAINGVTTPRILLLVK